MNHMKKYAVAQDSEGTLQLGIAFDFTDQLIAFVQQDSEKKMEIVSVSVPMLHAALELIQQHLTEDGEIYDPKLEKKIVN